MAGSFVHCHLVTLVSIVGLTGTVLAFSWVDEDAFISFRYARNILDGHGPVFNIGERVQGYTHPLWLGFLTFGMAIIQSPIVISVVLGLINTVVFVALVGETLRRRGAERWLPRLLLVVLAQIYLASNSWIVFQSSGLENSLTNILIAILIFEAFSKNPRPFLLSLSIVLLLCTRLDHIAFVAPVAMVVAFQTRTLRGWAMIIAGTSPFLCWAAFSYAYYGTVTPNTATAKVGIWPWDESIEHGLRYLWDWIRIEPVAALGAFGLLIAGVTMSRRPLALAVAAGCFLYLAYVVFVGGDYMRGRFLVTFLVGATLFGASVLLAELPRRAISPKAVNAVCGGLIAIALAFIAVSGVPDARANRGIVNEWAVYNGLHFSSYIFNDGYTFGGVAGTDVRHDLVAYVETCGPVTIHHGSIGALGFFTSSDVTVIDIIGLTDRYIAHLPKSQLVSTPRPGHPLKYIPLRYLAERGDISIFSDWEDAVARLDCDYPNLARRYADSDLLFDPRKPLEAPSQSEPRP